MGQSQLRLPADEIGALCRRHHIRKLSLFGSVLREDFTADSDVDVLVEFAPERTPGLLGFMGIEDELAGVFGRKVDLNTSQCLSKYFRDEVLAEAEVVYV